MNFRTLDDFSFKGKTVLVRADLNSPFDEKKKKISDKEVPVAPGTCKRRMYLNISAFFCRIPVWRVKRER